MTTNIQEIKMTKEFFGALELFAICYFRKLRQDKENVPDFVEKRNRRTISLCVKKLNDNFGFDILGFLATDEGSNFLLHKQVEQQEIETACERCNRCLHYEMKESEIVCSKGLMSEGIPLLCGEFSDCGFDSTQRLIQCVGRCMSCALREEGEAISCKEDRNILAVICNFKI